MGATETSKERAKSAATETCVVPLDLEPSLMCCCGGKARGPEDPLLRNLT